MKPVLTRAEVRELDRRATSEASVPSLELMENAGHGATELLLARYPEARRIVVVCGLGNNGGDGFVVARLLKTQGREARVLLVGDGERLRGDALENSRAWVDAGGSLTNIDERSLATLKQALAEAELVVDALFGTGLDRELSGLSRDVVLAINAAHKPTVALDLPSGLDADTGVALGVAVRASVTVTFARAKRGLLTPSGADHAGEISVVPIGIPPEIEARVGHGSAELEPADVAAAIPTRGTLSHKGSSGRVLVLAGSPGKIGAALLVAHGALRAGAGLVTLAAEPGTASAFEQRVLEAMTTRLDPNAPERSLDPLLERTNVVALGPGLGLDAFARRVVDHVVLGWPGLAVVDADALTLFSDRSDTLVKAPGKLVLTPHPGELARLLGCTTEDIEADRYGSVLRAVERTGRVVLLKGASTLIAGPGERIAVNPTGNGLLATGGAGDVLAGVVSALLVGSEPYRAACAGAYLHGAAAGILATERAVDRGVLAHEVADAVPRALWSVLHH
jgi:ADP-dependent NAD(P)H-hydrate dehydratase / NAD(P)H-hydrate epimerase